MFIVPHVLDPKFNGEYISRNERIKKKDFVDKIASRKFGAVHSAAVIPKLAEYRSKTAPPPGKSVCIKICVTGLTV
jgi:hypothetical protein